MAAETVKQQILQVVERLPDTATLEDAIEGSVSWRKLRKVFVNPMWARRFPTSRPFVSSSNDPADLDSSGIEDVHA